MNTVKTNGNLSSFVETKPKEEEIMQFAVFRKRWLWGERFFCICDEVMYYEECVLLKSKQRVIAILPKDSFSCAIKHEPEV